MILQHERSAHQLQLLSFGGGGGGEGGTDLGNWLSLLFIDTEDILKVSPSIFQSIEGTTVSPYLSSSPRLNSHSPKLPHRLYKRRIELPSVVRKSHHRPLQR